jgi:hypothetical protein
MNTKQNDLAEIAIKLLVSLLCCTVTGYTFTSLQYSIALPVHVNPRVLNYRIARVSPETAMQLNSICSDRDRNHKMIWLTATTAAVSVRKRRAPSDTDLNPVCAALAISSSVKPPSGPMAMISE